MNFSKCILQSMIIVVSFVVGAISMQVWNHYQTKTNEVFLSSLESDSSVRLADIQQGSLPDNWIDPTEPSKEITAPTVPSQLSKINVPDVQAVISRPVRSFSSQDEEYLPHPSASPIFLDEEATVVVGGRRLPAKVIEESAESKISMIDAPVESLLIKSLEEYRRFKQKARGSYPVVDFSKNNVLVLESGSNLPDKAFEIVSVNEDKGKMLVQYRINVFGLDKKTNTHNVVVVSKKNIPLELKQVL